MAIGAIGFFGRGDLMRQRMYWNGQRNPPMPMSSFAAGQVVDVGVMPGSVEGPAPGETAAVPAVSGYGSFSGWGRVTSGQVLSAVAAAPLGPAGIALALKKNNASIAHARKQVAHWKKVYMRLQTKGKKDKRVAMAKAKYQHWVRVLAQLTRKKAAIQKAKAHKKWEKKYTRRVKKAVRKGKVIPFTPAQRRRLAQQAASRTMTPMGLQTGAQVSSASLSSTVPPGSYDYMQATALPSVATSAAVAPAALMRAQDVDINDDGIRDDIPADDGSRTMTPGADGEDAAMTADAGGGIMDRVQGFFGDIPTWAWIVGGLGVGGLVFSRTAAGKRFIAKLKKKGGGGGGE